MIDIINSKILLVCTIPCELIDDSNKDFYKLNFDINKYFNNKQMFLHLHEGKKNKCAILTDTPKLKAVTK